MQLLVVFVAALLISAVFTRLVRDYSNRHGWASPPASDRHVHTRPIPRLGGVAIFLTLWCIALLGHWVPEHFGMSEFPLSQLTVKILGPATIIFLLGLIDDFCGLSAYIKFSVQALAAVLLYCNGIGISRLTVLAGHPHLGWLVGLPLTILWVLWITNAFNLIDGLDGLAAGSALLSTLVSCVVAMLGHNEVVLILTLALAGAITGFLRYNFNPASIFLGDCGSLLIGFLISAIAIAGSHKSPTMVAVAIPIVSLGLPILDVAVAVIRRFLSYKRLFAPDREHIHHKLLGRGISHRQTVLVLYSVSACFCLFSLLLLNPGGAALAAVLVVVGVGVLIGVQQLKYHEFLELGRVASRTLNQRHAIANGISVRRAADSLESCTSLPQFCQILRECLEPIGFDGFGLYLSTGLPVEAELGPFKMVSRYKVQYFWDQLPTPCDANWSLTFSLTRRNGKSLGGFTLYRMNTVSPLWMDLDVFTTTGFSNAVAECVENIQNAWPGQGEEEKSKQPAYEPSSKPLGSRFRPSIPVRSSG
ncbi:MAG TPA: MraY family glycosyltransferase [Candidatus Acidoferrales bacterium]|jgi:UDP-GlcNAc:undecaprenyl-phosphate GlcNAc-1-phosphate transferase|nr:MraY family glycosyltransferase [Candidatus Acidoferrales bacterium]